MLGIAAWALASRAEIPTDTLPTVQEARVLRWLSPLWRRALKHAGEAVGGAEEHPEQHSGAGLKGDGPLDALRRVRAGLKSGKKGAGVAWAAYGAVLLGTLCRVRGAIPRGKTGAEANVVFDPADPAQVDGGGGEPIPPAPGGGLIRAEVGEMLAEEAREGEEKR